MPQTLGNNQVTVTTAVTQIVPQNSARQSLLITNTSAATVYVGGAGVTSATGFPLLTNQTLKILDTNSIWGITASGSAVVAFFEEST